MLQKTGVRNAQEGVSQLAHALHPGAGANKGSEEGDRPPPMRSNAIIRWWVKFNVVVAQFRPSMPLSDGTPRH